MSGANSSNSKISAVKIIPTENAPVIDGVLTEDKWANAARLELTHQFEPQQLAQATERTEFERLSFKRNLGVLQDI